MDAVSGELLDIMVRKANTDTDTKRQDEVASHTASSFT